MQHAHMGSLMPHMYFALHAGLIQPELLADGQVKVDMGEPILEGPKVPTTLAPTQGTAVVGQELTVDGHKIKFTCVSMGNPHAVTYSIDGKPIKVGWCTACATACTRMSMIFSTPCHCNH